MLEEKPSRSEDDGDVVDIIENAHVVTLGLAYEGNGRLAGSAFEPILKNCDGFIAKPLSDAYEARQGRAEKLLEAAKILSGRPEAMQLRYLQTLTNIAGDKSSTIVFPMPIDLMKVLLESARTS